MLLEIVRCPYCVEGGCFRPMLRRSTGWFLCLGCGHMTLPSDPYAKCSCHRCHAMNQVARRCRRSSESRKLTADASIPALTFDEARRY